MGAPSPPPGRYFRMHLVGSFEGIDSERGLEWRCADSLSLRDFLGLDLRARVPDHSWLSRSRARLPLEVHERVFAWVLSNAEWASPSDSGARITRMQDGRTRLAYKPEHAVDLDTEAIVAAEIALPTAATTPPSTTPWRRQPEAWTRRAALRRSTAPPS